MRQRSVSQGYLKLSEIFQSLKEVIFLTELLKHCLNLKVWLSGGVWSPELYCLVFISCSEEYNLSWPEHYACLRRRTTKMKTLSLFPLSLFILPSVCYCLLCLSAIKSWIFCTSVSVSETHCWMSTGQKSTRLKNVDGCNTLFDSYELNSLTPLSLSTNFS